MALQILNVGTVAMDATGTRLRPAFIAVNAMLAELYSLAGSPGAQPVINVGTKPNSSPPGDSMPTIITKLNTAMAFLFAAANHPSYQIVFPTGSSTRIIGTGAPGRYMAIALNSMFIYLYSVL